MKKKIFESEDDLTNEVIKCDTVQEVITLFEKFKNLFGANATVYFRATGWEEQFEFSLSYYREESEEEYKDRLKKEAKNKEMYAKRTAKRQTTLLKKREKEKAEYERLKAIYGEKQ